MTGEGPLERPDGPLERLSALLAAAGTTEAAALTGGRAIALGWATVELDRAAAELGQALHVPPELFVEAAGTPVLGAQCRVAAGILPDGISLALLEPITEGRLASTLARRDEGPAAVWLGVDDLARAIAAVQERDGYTPLARPGPFGDECLLLDGPIHGPHRLLIEAGYHPRMTDAAQITLRSARPTDAAAIAALFTDEGYPAGPSDILARLEHFSSPESRVVVAEHEEAILGFIAVHAMARFEHDDWILRILALVVDAGARERGVGRALMGEAERIGLELGAAFVELTAGHHRPEARHLYESLGYDATVTAYLRKKL